MPEKTKNISEKAYLHLRENLLNSGVYVGQKILHHELGKKLGISHTPLREALFRLAAEGLLSHENYKGFSIAPITLVEARELYETRELIEPFMAVKAAAVVADRNFRTFYSILAKYEDLLSEPYSRQRLLIDKKFHLEIATLAGNRTILQMLNQVYDKIIFKSPLERASAERGTQAIAEHIEILKCLEKRDQEQIFLLMRAHIENQKNFLLQNLTSRQNSQQFEPIQK